MILVQNKTAANCFETKKCELIAKAQSKADHFKIKQIYQRFKEDPSLQWAKNK